MGIGPVDPILPSIAQGLDATTGQVSLLFTSYFLITAVAMPPTGFVSSRIGGKKTLPLGLALVVVFAGLAGTSGSVGELVGFRAGRGLGNALFVSTALAVIVGAAAGGSTAAILLYGSALGLGMACGPLLGALPGDASWRYPFAHPSPRPAPSGRGDPRHRGTGTCPHRRGQRRRPDRLTGADRPSGREEAGPDRNARGNRPTKSGT
jgi:MFS family permease